MAKRSRNSGGASGKTAGTAGSRKAGSTPLKSSKTSGSRGGERRASSKVADGQDGSPRLLSGGNPQIPKGDGEGPVRAYIEAVPGWKREVVERLDRLIEGAVPGVRRAVKWNSPFYGAPGEPRERGWFASLHCYTRFVRVTFMNGRALTPMPTGASKMPKVRYLDVYQDGPGVLNEAQFVKWVKQASVAPGEWM